MIAATQNHADDAIYPYRSSYVVYTYLYRIADGVSAVFILVCSFTETQ